MNYANDLYGVENCRGYGDSILLLKNSVRPRVTFCDTRKYATGEVVSTLRYPYAVLSMFDIRELKVLLCASKGLKLMNEGEVKIKEIHVHGPILMHRDVEMIVTWQKERLMYWEEVEIF